jgi:hypothetical protein
MAALIRTNQGRLEAFNPRSMLSDDLKLLIKFIDGRRHYSDLQQALKPHICSKEKVQQLIELGLVEKNESFQQPVKQTEQNGHAFLPTVPAGLSMFGLLLSNSANEPKANACEEVIEDAGHDFKILHKAKECMADFLLMYAPQLAFEILSDIEELNSVAQFQASMDTYASLISKEVTVAQKNHHLQQLQSILSGSL